MLTLFVASDAKDMDIFQNIVEIRCAAAIVLENMSEKNVLIKIRRKHLEPVKHLVNHLNIMLIQWTVQHMLGSGGEHKKNKIYGN